jgi:nicotinate-nucleotide adenylyltransferase
MVKTSPFLVNYSSMRVGILGGTFNPPHVGHLRLAEEVACFHGLDRVVFVPSSIPPHKSVAGVVCAEDRLEMTRRACQDNPLFQVSDIELTFESPSYTVNTLEFFIRTESSAIYFILGTDSLREISTWKDYQRLFVLANFIVVNRPGTSFTAAWKDAPKALREQFQVQDHYLLHRGGARLIPSPINGLDICATTIRSLVKSGHSIRYLVPEPVRSYIIEKELYYR